MSTPCVSDLEYNDGLFHLRTSVGRRPSQKDLENFCNQYIFLFPAGPGVGPVVGPGWVLGRPFGIQLAVAMS
jgi:hypothetical protein